MQVTALRNRACRYASLVNANFSVNQMCPIICRWKLVKHRYCFGDNRRTKDNRKIKLCGLKACCVVLSTRIVSGSFPIFAYSIRYTRRRWVNQWRLPSVINVTPNLSDFESRPVVKNLLPILSSLHYAERIYTPLYSQSRILRSSVNESLTNVG